MDQTFDYMSKGIEHIIRSIMKSTLKNPKETAFVLKFSKSVKAAEKIRADFGMRGEYIPPFLMASIAACCNLHCKGCYARATKSCTEDETADEMTADRWSEIFLEAKAIGIPFVLLLGGEPFMRRDVIERAAEIEEIVFSDFHKWHHA
ncbi:MAG: radical SAM protein [Clostridia bacterium]|nr:radical SAM protein [Clostridia bacterium]